TDEIIATLESLPLGEDTPWTEIASLSRLAGQELGWCWIGRNYRGYLDMFTISFGGIDPSWTFVAAGSELECKQIVSIAEEQPPAVRNS
ncbi:MAG: DUF6334 family protein, partial [Rhizomicrobium sp.]